MTKDLKAQVAEWEFIINEYDQKPESGNWDKMASIAFAMFQAVKQLLAENATHKETILFLGNENNKLKSVKEYLNNPSIVGIKSKPQHNSWDFMPDELKQPE